MDGIIFGVFVLLILVAGVFGIRWGMRLQKKLSDDLANDPEYMAVPRGSMMWPTIRTRNATRVAEADLETIDHEPHGTPVRMFVWRARVYRMGLAHRATFRLDKLGIPAGFAQSYGAAGGFPYGGFPSGDPRFDLLYRLEGTAAPVSGALVTAPAVRMALQNMEDIVRVVKLEPDDSLAVEVLAHAVDAADAKRALGLVRQLAEALHAAGAGIRAA